MFVENGKYPPTLSADESFVLLQAAQAHCTPPAIRAFLTDFATNRQPQITGGDPFDLLYFASAVQVACVDRLQDPRVQGGLRDGLTLMALDVEFLKEFSE